MTDDVSVSVKDEHTMVVSSKLDVLAEFACPHCGGGRVSLCRVRLTGGGAVVHTVPTCRVFDNLDPAEFATSCRKKLVGEVADA